MAKCVVSAFMEVGEYMEGQETKRRKCPSFTWDGGGDWGGETSQSEDELIIHLKG